MDTSEISFKSVFRGKMSIFCRAEYDTERRQGVELGVESCVRSVPPSGTVTLYYTEINRFVQEFARRHEGVAKHIIG